MIDSRRVDHFKDLSERLKALLALKRVSQKELHDRSGVSISRINEYVKGKGGPPTLPTLNRLLDALGATRGALFSDLEPQGDEAESEWRSLQRRMASLEEQNSFLEAEFGRLEQSIEELKKTRGSSGSEDESDDARAAH